LFGLNIPAIIALFLIIKSHKETNMLTQEKVLKHFQTLFDWKDENGVLVESNDAAGMFEKMGCIKVKDLYEFANLLCREEDPNGYTTWYEATIKERLRRIKAEERVTELEMIVATSLVEKTNLDRQEKETAS
jgi:hypothetical protein